MAVQTKGTLRERIFGKKSVPAKPAARWGMVIDLERCIGCNACTLACKSENGTPKGVLWARVLETEIGKYPNARREFLPVLCNHCANPPCVEVCPTGATYQRSDGIVMQDYDVCIGCRYCMMACPYDVRFFMDEIQRYYEEPNQYEDETYAQFQVNTVTKCIFCYHRVDQGLDPACVITCPTECRIFGDLNDPDSHPSRLIRERRGYVLRPETGADPRVYYIQ